VEGFIADREFLRDAYLAADDAVHYYQAWLRLAGKPEGFTDRTLERFRRMERALDALVDQAFDKPKSGEAENAV